MTRFVTLRQATVGVALIVALAACGSAATTTSNPTLGPTGTPAAVATAIPTAVPTASPAPTVESGLSWKYTRAFVAKSFTDKFGFVFTQEKLEPPLEDPTWVDSPRGTFGKPAAVFVSIRGAAASGDSLVVTVYVNRALVPTADEEMVFALQLMTDSNLTTAALDWLNGELAKANADKNTFVDDKMTFGSAKLHFQANEDYGGGTRSGSALRIDPAT